MQETIDGSVVKYYDLHSLEAAQRPSTLQQALDQMADLNRQRGDMLRTSSHDLQGSLGMISGAASMLKLDSLPQEQREKYLAMLNRNLNNVQLMLSTLMDLARLEAGEEMLQLQLIDVAPLLRELVGNAQGIATERGLLLRADGPAPLMVQTDPLKLQRIVQNLLLNALKYTSAGFISVSWSREDHARWMFSIQDSGPGLPLGLAGVFGEQLRPTVEATSVLSPSESEPVAVLPVDVPKIPTGAALDQQTNRSPKGEGVGLQIVKRLCELLGASLEIESVEGRGTLFRIRMPIHHT